MTAPAVDLDAVAEGLWRRLRDVVLAERRLERFAFTEEPRAPTGARGLTAQAGDAAAVADLARDMTLRALAATADPTSCRLLEALGDTSLALGDLAAALGLPPLAVSERVGALAQLGLATRDLERDSVSATTAGRGLAAVVRTISSGLEARWRAGAEALL